MNGNGELIWRWAVRILGAVGFVTLLVLLSLDREINVAWIVLIGSMIGLEPIINWQERNRND
jgi:hypothetical protein